MNYLKHAFTNLKIFLISLGIEVDGNLTNVHLNSEPRAKNFYELKRQLKEDEEREKSRPQPFPELPLSSLLDEIL